jgi:hypothetical protein
MQRGDCVLVAVRLWRLFQTREGEQRQSRRGKEANTHAANMGLKSSPHLYIILI